MLDSAVYLHMDDPEIKGGRRCLSFKNYLRDPISSPSTLSRLSSYITSTPTLSISTGSCPYLEASGSSRGT